jgi:acetyl esterase/lipase
MKKITLSSTLLIVLCVTLQACAYTLATPVPTLTAAPAATTAALSAPTATLEPGSLTENVVYNATGDQPQKLDVYLPEGLDTSQSLYPAILFIHGGQWRSSDKVEEKGLAKKFAKAGFVGFTIDYHLADQYKYPQQLDDVQKAVRWVRANAATYKVDPQRIGALGVDMGGQLAALLGETDTRDNSDATLAKYSSRVNAVVTLFSPTDITSNPATQQDGPFKDEVVNLFGQSPDAVADLAKSASPLYVIDAKTVPFLIFQGANNDLVPVDQSRQFYAALQKAGIDVKYVEMADENKGLSTKSNDDLFYNDTLDFFTAHLAKK